MRSQTSGLDLLSEPAQGIGHVRATGPGSRFVEASLPPVGVILNPRSHRNRHVRMSDFDLPGVTTVTPRTKPEIAEALKRFADSRIGILAIGGGDGTVRDVLTRAAPIFGDNWPRIIVLPQGKTNALAIDLGVPSKWTLRSALEAARHGRTVVRHPLVVERRDGEVRSRFGFILGAGVFNPVIEAGQVAHRFGAFQSFAVGVTAVFGIIHALCGWGNGPWRKLYSMRLTDATSGQALPRSEHGERDARFLAAFTTLQQFPLGIRPFLEPEDSRPIRYFLIDAPLRRAVAMFPQIMFGRAGERLPELGMHRGAGVAFDVELAEGFILDGERFPPGSYCVSAGPAMPFVTP